MAAGCPWRIPKCLGNQQFATHRLADWTWHLAMSRDRSTARPVGRRNLDPAGAIIGSVCPTFAFQPRRLIFAPAADGCKKS